MSNSIDIKYYTSNDFKSIQSKLTGAKNTIYKYALQSEFKTLLTDDEIKTLKNSLHILHQFKCKIEYAKEKKKRLELEIKRKEKTATITALELLTKLTDSLSLDEKLRIVDLRGFYHSGLSGFDAILNYVEDYGIEKYQVMVANQLKYFCQDAAGKIGRDAVYQNYDNAMDSNHIRAYIEQEYKIHSIGYASNTILSKIKDEKVASQFIQHLKNEIKVE